MSRSDIYLLAPPRLLFHQLEALEISCEDGKKLPKNVQNHTHKDNKAHDERNYKIISKVYPDRSPNIG